MIERGPEGKEEAQAGSEIEASANLKVREVYRNPNPFVLTIVRLCFYSLSLSKILFVRECLVRECGLWVLYSV